MEKESWLALACGRHPRCGRESPIGLVDGDILRRLRRMLNTVTLTVISTDKSLATIIEVYKSDICYRVRWKELDAAIIIWSDLMEIVIWLRSPVPSPSFAHLKFYRDDFTRPFPSGNQNHIFSKFRSGLLTMTHLTYLQVDDSSPAVPIVSSLYPYEVAFARMEKTEKERKEGKEDRGFDYARTIPTGNDSDKEIRLRKTPPPHLDMISLVAPMIPALLRFAERLVKGETFIAGEEYRTIVD